MGSERETERCQYVDDGNERFLLPGCMGAAVYGEKGCTCDPVKGSNADLRQRVEELEGMLEQQRAIARDRGERMNELARRLDALERRVRGDQPRPTIDVDPEN